MIIGINGKIGSGKDTIGKIAQCLINHPKVTNKDLLWMIENDVVAEEYSKCEIKKFAGKLKQIASLLTGIDIEDFEDQEFKKSHLGSEWGTVRSNPLNAVPVFEDVQFNELMSVREFLQKLGTEAMREGLHTNVWVNALFADYKAIERIPEKRMSIMPNWIITDMRFPNEMDAVVKRGGLTIKVIRPVKKSKTTPRLHPSETSLDKAKFDYEIINDKSIDDLIKKVREILITEKII